MPAASAQNIAPAEQPSQADACCALPDPAAKTLLCRGLAGKQSRRGAITAQRGRRMERGLPTLPSDHNLEISDLAFRNSP
jgi:hypothetical protein